MMWRFGGYWLLGTSTSISRFSATISDDSRTIAGRWERAPTASYPSRIASVKNSWSFAEASSSVIPGSPEACPTPFCDPAPKSPFSCQQKEGL
jgi:hypothetical protein